MIGFCKQKNIKRTEWDSNVVMILTIFNTWFSRDPGQAKRKPYL